MGCCRGGWVRDEGEEHTVEVRGSAFSGEGESEDEGRGFGFAGAGELIGFSASWA